MCVALPARVVWIGTQTETSTPARAIVADSELEIDLVMVPDVAVGDHVIVHSGYAINVVTEEAAAHTMRLLGASDDH